LAVTVRVAGVVATFGETDSQLPPVVAAEIEVGTGLLTASAWVAGCPPCGGENEMVGCETDIVDAALTTRVAGTLIGEFVTPTALTVTDEE
jgi:hypothetical protein